MHNLASNSKHSHGVEGSETEDTSLLQCFAGQFSRSQLSAVALWVVVMYTMNSHIYNAMRVCDSGSYKALYLSLRTPHKAFFQKCYTGAQQYSY